jgi:aryl-alcohol dehydrogenase-like predicted oxidoreductase
VTHTSSHTCRASATGKFRLAARARKNLEVITAPIVGATKLHHLDNALASVNVKLSRDEITSLEEQYVPHAVVGFV